MPPKKKAAPAPSEEPTTGPPSVEDVAAALDADTDAVNAVYGAEKAHQASVTHVPSARAQWPDDLTRALVRRVEVALNTGPRTGGSDSEVRRLEADHSKRVAG